MNATTAGAAAAAAVWAVLVARSPPWFFAAAAPFSAAWIALSLRAAPPGVRARLRPPGARDLAAALAVALALYAATRALLWAGCGGWSSALCDPVAGLYGRFPTRTPLAAVVLALLVAPAEELFWRGVVQERLVRRLGVPRGVAVAASLSSLLPLATGEPILALAALPTSAAWGLLAARRGLAAPIASHAVWTVLVASLAPPL